MHFERSNIRRLRPSLYVRSFIGAFVFGVPGMIVGQDILPAGWIGDWSADITPSGCTLETKFRDTTAELNPSINFDSYVTHDPFRLFFSYSEASLLGPSDEMSSGMLFLWLQPQTWDNLAPSQLDIVGVTIGGQELELHRPSPVPELLAFYLVGPSAISVYEDLIEDRSVDVEIRAEQGETFVRVIPLANGRQLRFRIWSRMFEACYEEFTLGSGIHVSGD